MTFDAIRPVADTILFEGYALYPYRASSLKNRFRWTFGVLAPRAWVDAGGSERSSLRLQVLVEPDPTATASRLEGQLRFLHLEQRTIEERRSQNYFPVERLEVDGRLEVSWDEGVLHEVDWVVPDIAALTSAHHVQHFEAAAAVSVDLIVNDRGECVGRTTRRRLAAGGTIVVSAERLDAPRPLMVLEVQVHNETPCSEPAAHRSQILPLSLLSTHLVLRVEGGAFVSLLDPPDWARAAAAKRVNEGTFPVLAGAPGSRDAMLAAPFVLYDHVAIAKESEGDSFDATEIDALIGLSTRTLTDEEKREARAMDARTRALVDRSEALGREQLERLHGAIRDYDAPSQPPVRRLRPGCRVRLLPSRRRADAQDFLMTGMTALVEKVEVDAEGHEHAAVTFEADPAAELHRWYGRFHYFRADELELVADPAPVDDMQGEGAV